MCGLAILIAGATAATSRSATTTCSDEQPQAPRDVGTATQAVVVAAAGARSTSASLSLWQRRTAGCWSRVSGPWNAWVGRNGLSAAKHEGDGTTPTGVFALGPVAYGLSPDPGVRLRYHRLVCGDWWDEDSRSPTYNTFQHVSCGARPSFGGSSEALWQQTVAYRHFAVIRYNDEPIVPGRGSAIFLHVSLGRPTNGCVSLPEEKLVRLLRWLRPAANPVIAIRA